MQQKTSEKVGFCLIMLNLIIILMVTWITVYISYRSVAVKVNLFSLHPSLMAFGVSYSFYRRDTNVNKLYLSFITLQYLMFMFQAILVIGEKALWGNKLKFTTRITFHWILQFLAWTCIAIAFGAIIVNKNLLGRPHFATTHAIFGLVTLVGTQLLAFGGIWAKYSTKLRFLMKPVRVKLLHSFFGVVVFNLALITIGLGLYSKWWDRVSTETHRYLIIPMLAAISMFTSARPLAVCAKRFRTAFRRSNTDRSN